jgi:hypothetical protein
MIDYQRQPLNKHQPIVRQTLTLPYLRYSRPKGKMIQYNLFSTGGLTC